MLDVLRFRLDSLGVKIVTSFEVEKVKKKKSGFNVISYNGQCEYADNVLSQRGKAAPNLGSKGVGYEILESFGHKVTELSPSLVQIKTETDVVKKLKGIKLKQMYRSVTLKNTAKFCLPNTVYQAPAVFSLFVTAEKSKDNFA